MLDIINAIYKDGQRSLRELEKYLNRQLIYHILAPQKIADAKAIRKSYGDRVKEVATSTQQSITRITEQLDTSIKGEWSQKIQTVTRDENSKYEEL